MIAKPFARYAWSLPPEVQASAGAPFPLTVQLLAASSGPLPLDGSLALFCSAQAPAGVLLAVHDLAQGWRHGRQIIMSGFHSPTEQEALTILLRDPGRLIYCPARSLPQRLKPEWQEALAAGRLWIVSPFGETVRRATRETARVRNHFVAALVGTLLFAHARPGTMTFDLAQKALAWGRRVYTIGHEANRPLLEIGVQVFEAAA
jgi:hypothetical protein